jgi:flagellar hook assembly protein FlgD
LSISPNPFSGSTRLEFRLPEARHAVLRIFDVAGREVRTLLNGETEGRGRAVTWDGRDDRGRLVAPGTYFGALEADGGAVSRKVIRLP